MFYRIFAVAENGWVELVKRRVLYILAAAVVLGFWGPVVVQHKWLQSAGAGAPQALQGTVLALDQFMLFVGLCAAVLFGAGSIEAEVTQRTLCSVMIRPIHRWEYLAGRALSVILFFLTFALAAGLCSYAAAFLYGFSMPATFLWGVVQRVCRGSAWILIALSLGSITSSASTVSLIVVVVVLSALAPHLSNDIHWVIPAFKKFLHYATPCDWTTDFFAITGKGTPDQSLGVNAAIWLENLMYGVVVFLMSSWVFSKRDLKLRE
jgi:ABC-type transport system involved in multi-copper enzyme maturation permease subunit